MVKSSTLHEGQGRRILHAALASILAASLSVTCFSCRPAPTLVVVAGGDCLLDRFDGREGTAPEDDRRWDSLETAARGSDAFLLNLETAVGKLGSPKEKRFVFRASPAALLPLTRFPHPIAALANNHSMDYGAEGLHETLTALDEAGIAHTGAGKTTEEAWAEASVSCRGGVLSVLSCGFDNDESSYSGANAAAIAPMDAAKLEERIMTCKNTSLAVVVMLHWGIEYETRHSRSEEEFARSLVDAGADLVIGSGPHVLQGFERYRDSLICYSLGNLVFDDLGDDDTSASCLVRMTIASNAPIGHSKQFEVAPLRTTRIVEGPSRPSLPDAGRIIQDLSLRSRVPEIIRQKGYSLKNGVYWYPIR